MAVGRDPKGKTWHFVVDLPAGPDGRRRQMRRRGFASERVARERQQEALAQFGGAELAADGTVAAELDRWLDERELDLSITGLSTYRDFIREYINPHLGSRQVASLDKNVVHDFYKTLLRSGSRRGRPLAAGTVRTVHRILHKALRDIGVEIAGVRQPRKPHRFSKGRKGVWTAEETVAFLGAVREDRPYAVWVLAVVCGMRRGELAGLRWSKVDLRRGVSRGVICTDWQRTTATGQGDRGVVEKETKGSSARNIAIGESVIAVLTEHRRRQDAERALAGEIYRDEDRVFCREDGLGYPPAYFTRRFGRACEGAGVPVIALHDARHTLATVGADAGVPQHARQDRMGHSDSRVTAEIYTHVLPPAQRKAAEVMERVLLPEGRSSEPQT
ncbi:tyrosine-type recombinase/integrase [Plantactinospora sp. CA-290183]|uniref:tyrosine-type recombinase/integrase n=1 Tax=Plantactinospora sp. CA-290183 TaxID=3240006 RepID=UPI003D8C2E3D